MNRALLCHWLNLPTDAWPPDDFTLLGVTRQTAEPGDVEQRVHERMARLRQFQLKHPEEVTEGMNRLAQAYVIVTEACQVPVATPTLTLTTSDTPTATDWRVTPPPVRGEPVPSETVPASSVEKVAPPVGLLERPRTSFAEELGRHSPVARQGLTTLGLVLDRIHLTRHLTIIWTRIGGMMRRATKRTPRATDAAQFEPLAEELNETLADFPELLGRPGLPGYRVAALTRLEFSLDMVNALDDTQRKELVKDWDAGLRVLLAHRSYLLERLKELRKQSMLVRWVHGVVWVIGEHPTLARWVAVLIGALLLTRVVLWVF